MFAICLALSGCVLGLSFSIRLGASSSPNTILDGLLPADVLLLGEQHDAPLHQQRQREVLDALIAQDQAAALVIEMAEQGGDTRLLPTNAKEAEVRQVLDWTASEAAGWQWSVYGPLVMRAVRAGVPVWGGNLPRARLGATMQDASIDAQVSASAGESLRNHIRDGHCQLLPASQITPMTRVQIARDQTLAHTTEAAIRSGKTVLLVAGNQHVRRDLGVPVHLSSQLRSRVVIMRSGDETSAAEPGTDLPPSDRVWRTASVPIKDHCAELKARLGG